MSTETADLHSTPTMDTALESQDNFNQTPATSPRPQPQPTSTLSDNTSTPPSETHLKNGTDDVTSTTQQGTKATSEEVADLPGENASTATTTDEDQAAKQTSQSIESNEE